MWFGSGRRWVSWWLGKQSGDVEAQRLRRGLADQTVGMDGEGASRTSWRETGRRWTEQLDATLYGARMARRKKAGLQDVSEVVKSSCWAWNQAGQHPYEEGAEGTCEWRLVVSSL